MTFPSSAIRDDPAPACPPVAGTGPRDPGRAGRYTGAFLAILLVGIAVRAALIAFGRTTVLDGFYLAAAFRLGAGDLPYRDFVHVAFPLLEALYAPFLALPGPLLSIASGVTGIAVIATSLLLFGFGAARHSKGAGIAAALLYLTAAPVLAFHAFERELYTALAFAGALYLLRDSRSHAPSLAVLAGVGICLCAALLAKLTAVVGTVAIGIELLMIGGVRALLVAAFAGILPFVAITLLLYGAYGAEFAVQVFVFYFFKGEAGTLSARALEMMRVVDPALALGLAGAVVTSFLLVRTARPLLLLLAAWLAHYLLVSPSFWDHNAIDLLLPAAALGGLLIGAALRRKPLWLAVAVAVIASLPNLRPPGLRPIWHPHGFGADVGHYVPYEVAVLEEFATSDDLVVAPNPLTAAIARRRSFITDYELEPVARGVLADVRHHGLLGALRFREQGVLLGVPDGLPRLESRGNLFQDRVEGNARFHLGPRVADAVLRGEIAVLIEPLPLRDGAVFGIANYALIERPPIRARIRGE
jgi:hypothetical protein